MGMTDPYIKSYLVGGAVRDILLGLTPHDMDYTVVAPSYAAMKFWLEDQRLTIIHEKEDFGLIKARKDGDVADFMLARKEGPYSDHRHPDWVNVGSLEDDLRRRDFTINAMARDDDGNIIDMFQGEKHLDAGILVAVGNPLDRLREDPLRAFRAIRFAVTKGMRIEHDLHYAMQNEEVLGWMTATSTERIREEMTKAFAFDTVGTMLLLADYRELLDIMVSRGVWLKPVVEKVKGN